MNIKRFVLLISLITVALGGLVACSDDNSADSSTPYRRVFPKEPCPTFVSNATIPDSGIYFQDPNLEMVIRVAIGKPDGAIEQSDVEQLSELNATSRHIFILDGLEYCTSLTKLNLSDNCITNLSPLSSLTNLTELTVGANQIDDITALSGLTNITYLDLSINRLSDISALAELTNLSHLNLGGNDISDIRPLSGLSELKELNLFGNLLNDSDLPVLSNLNNLTYLDLTNDFWGGPDRITDIRPLSELCNLRSLSLGGNDIVDISPLSSLTDLTELALYSNELTDISALSNLRGLRVLILRSNQISDISTLVNLTNLQELNLENNEIKDISTMVANPGLSINDTLVIADNPLNAKSKIEYIPQLEERGVVVIVKIDED